MKLVSLIQHKGRRMSFRLPEGKEKNQQNDRTEAHPKTH